MESLIQLVTECFARHRIEAVGTGFQPPLERMADCQISKSEFSPHHKASKDPAGETTP